MCFRDILLNCTVRLIFDLYVRYYRVIVKLVGNVGLFGIFWYYTGLKREGHCIVIIFML